MSGFAVEAVNVRRGWRVRLTDGALTRSQAEWVASKLSSHPRRRIEVIALVQCSAGSKAGGWDGHRWLAEGQCRCEATGETDEGPMCAEHGADAKGWQSWRA